MFAKVIAFAALALSISSVSAVDYSCNTGNLTCCSEIQDVGSYDADIIAALVGVSVDDVTGQLGLQCNPITVIGVGTGGNCASTPVCCEQNFQNQLIGLNCNSAIVQA
ncbi:hypothetical protein CVT24_007634 [Panaeolus cyanescens]|uniref:Hydrophobin n=1 Tax=Panaeolus cyanescens TaxID=181874 RepID=A0A409W5B2_9AGAR|nr:hypothetical protein CVT24_007634 [Panaeolus cyanescens]